MHTAAGAYPGMRSTAPSHDRAALLSSLRQSTADPHQQAKYDLQQAQLELQLHQLQLQNLELQSALLAQAQAAMGSQQSSYSHQPAMSRSDQQRTRRELAEGPALAPRTRHTSAHGALSGSDVLSQSQQTTRATPRLSFGANDGISLADRARARHSRHQSIELPVARQQSPVESTFRPTLVLSKPGEAFPDTKITTVAGASKSGHHKSDSQSSSCSSVSDRSSNGSEPVSFESITSLGSPQYAGAVNKLNPSAMTFMPTNGIAPPILTTTTPPPRAPRWTPQPNTALVLVTRQPRGPAREEEMESKNFASRIRRRAIVSLKKGRNSFAGVMPQPV